jgi:hypothetical protein
MEPPINIMRIRVPMDSPIVLDLSSKKAGVMKAPRTRILIHFFRQDLRERTLI